MQQTLAQKIIAQAARLDYVIPGEVVTAKVDLAMIHDSGGPRRVAPILRDLGVGLWDKDKVFLVSDHFVPGDTKEASAILRLTRDWARETGVRFLIPVIALKSAHNLGQPCTIFVSGSGAKTAASAELVYSDILTATKVRKI
jgi:homoaconitase/3-isopropylmalate dehydratase large subunit